MGRAQMGAGHEEGRKGEILWAGGGVEHAKEDGESKLGGGAAGEGSDEGIVHEGVGVGCVGEDGGGVVEVGGGGEGEEAGGGDGVVCEAAAEEVGVEEVEVAHGAALCVEEGK